MSGGVFCTCVAGLQSRSVRRHQTGISGVSRVSHPHVEGAAGNMAAVKLHVDGVHAVLTRDEADGGFIWNIKVQGI